MTLAPRILALLATLVAAAPPALAESLVATRTIRAQSIIMPDDVDRSDTVVPGALTDPGDAVGREARVVIYPGRPILARDLVEPAVVARNQIVILRYSRGALTIEVEGRTLGRGAVGDAVRVMNLASRTTVSGVVLPDGSVGVASSAIPSTIAEVRP
jgi:flagella basal body P-ring formation protein FlgA